MPLHERKLIRFNACCAVHFLIVQHPLDLSVELQRISSSVSKIILDNTVIAFSARSGRDAKMESTVGKGSHETLLERNPRSCNIYQKVGCSFDYTCK